jgi:hypothetical protein
MAVNRKVDKTTTRSMNFSFDRHDGDRVIVLSTFLLAAMMAIGW